MLPTDIKGIVLYITSLEVILGLSISWLQKLNHALSDVASMALAVSGVVIAYYTILHIKEKVIGQRLDNEIKKFELKSKQDA